MTQIRFGRLIVLACMGLAVACTTGTDGGTAGNTELNLDIVNPGGTSGELGFSIDRVDYRITCAGNPPGSYPIPDADTSGTDYNYNDSVDISGAFEVVDTRVPPVWQAVMDLPPGDCTVTLSVYEDDEIVCVGSQTLVINEDATTKYDIVLVCSLSIDTPDGMADIDGTFEFITGNLCPKLYVLNAIPSTVVQDTNNPNAATEIQYRAKDPDNTCGNNCDPQVCDFSNPPVCTPSVYNPNDPLCNPLAGGNPASAACLADGAGLVCTVAGWPSASNPGGPGTGAPGGTFISPADGVTPVGPVLPVNLNTASGIPGIILPGLGGPAGTNAENSPAYPPLPNVNGSLPPLVYECDTAQPGPTYITVSCSDGDADCDQAKFITLSCPGINFCVDQPLPGGSCNSGNDCTTNGTCDVNCDPADIGGPGCPGGTRCPGEGANVADGTACNQGGGTQCLAGTCVECVSAAGCLTNPSAPVDCQLPNTCVANSCVAGGTAPAGTPCSNGECDGSGIGAGACQFVACDPCEQNCGQSGGPDFDINTCNQSVTLGCTNNITPDVSILPWQLTANPTTILSNSAFSVQYGGSAVFSETFLDAGLSAVPGLKIAKLVAAVATAHVRSGATGADVVLNAAPIAPTCGGGANVGLACTPGNEAVDCPPGLPFVECGQFVPIPTIDGTGDACAACNAINATKAAQCAANGYCIAQGGLSIPLQTPTGNYTANASGQVLIGFQDQGTGATIAANGTYNLPAASFPAAATPNGVRVIASVLQVALQCTMAVDSGGPDGTSPPVPDLSSPTPSSLLSTFNIQVP